MAGRPGRYSFTASPPRRRSNTALQPSVPRRATLSARPSASARHQTAMTNAPGGRSSSRGAATQPAARTATETPASGWSFGAQSATNGGVATPRRSRPSASPIATTAIAATMTIRRTTVSDGRSRAPRCHARKRYVAEGACIMGRARPAPAGGVRVPAPRPGGWGPAPAGELPAVAEPPPSPPLTADPAGTAVARAAPPGGPVITDGGRTLARVLPRERVLELYDAGTRRRTARAAAGV